MRAIVAGALSLEPFAAGIAWDWIQIAIGLKRLGHDVLFVEQMRPEWGVDRSGNPATYRSSVNRERFVRVMERFGLWESCCQLYGEREASTGMSVKDALAWAESADLLLNVSGHLDDPEILGRVRTRAYLDQDPVYTQLWAAEYKKDLGFDHHDVFFTVGLEIGKARCPIPTGGVKWHAMLPPIVSDLWEPVTAPDTAPFTTVASLSVYAELEFDGNSYGSKYEEFRRFAQLPALSSQTMEVTLKAFRSKDPLIVELQQGGWAIRDGGSRLGMEQYQEYLAASRAEIGIAQDAYVAGRSGWFSDRSAHYLAMGKPVLAQATGFEHHVPVGEGLVAFSDVPSALEGIAVINRDYVRHCRSARRLAEDHLDYREVLPPLLETCRTASMPEVVRE